MRFDIYSFVSIFDFFDFHFPFVVFSSLSLEVKHRFFLKKTLDLRFVFYTFFHFFDVFFLIQTFDFIFFQNFHLIFWIFIFFSGNKALPQGEYLLHRENTSSTGRIPLPQGEYLSHRGTCLPSIENNPKY